ncbi:trimeric LpxA-like protein [Haematococcus lacustris]
MLSKYNTSYDFGRDLIPQALQDGYKVLALELDGPWQDVGGSIADFFAAHMAMAEAGVLSPTSRVDPQQLASQREAAEEATFFDPQAHSAPLFQAASPLPPCQYGEGVRVKQSLVSPGCVLGEGLQLQRVVVGPRAVLGAHTVIQDSVIMGSDYFEAEKKPTNPVNPNYPPLGIGAGCEIRRAIVDKNARIGANVRLLNQGGLRQSADFAALGVYIRDGIIVVTKGGVIPDNTVI